MKISVSFLKSNYSLDETIQRINQVELSLAVGLSRSTVNKWVTQKAIPRIAVIEKLASYFGVPRAYFLEMNGGLEKRAYYYLEAKTAIIAQQIQNNPELGLLFDVAKDATPEDILLATEVLKRIEKRSK